MHGHVYAACMSSALNQSSALQHFEHGNAIEIHNRIMFNFYPGMPQIDLVIPYTCTEKIDLALSAS